MYTIATPMSQATASTRTKGYRKTHPNASIVTFNSLQSGTVYEPDVTGNTIPGVPELKAFCCFGTHGYVVRLNSSQCHSFVWAKSNRTFSAAAFQFSRLYKSVDLGVSNPSGGAIQVRITAFASEEQTANEYVMVSAGQSTLDITSLFKGKIDVFEQVTLDIVTTGYLGVDFILLA